MLHIYVFNLQKFLSNVHFYIICITNNQMHASGHVFQHLRPHCWSRNETRASLPSCRPCKVGPSHRKSIVGLACHRLQSRLWTSLPLTTRKGAPASFDCWTLPRCPPPNQFWNQPTAHGPCDSTRMGRVITTHNKTQVACCSPSNIGHRTNSLLVSSILPVKQTIIYSSSHSVIQ
jgi:hypothetical protein